MLRVRGVSLLARGDSVDLRAVDAGKQNSENNHMLYFEQLYNFGNKRRKHQVAVRITPPHSHVPVSAMQRLFLKICYLGHGANIQAHR